VPGLHEGVHRGRVEECHPGQVDNKPFGIFADDVAEALAGGCRR
jgi:hypothetical protein